MKFNFNFLQNTDDEKKHRIKYSSKILTDIKAQVSTSFSQYRGSLLKTYSQSYSIDCKWKRRIYNFAYLPNAHTLYLFNSVQINSVYLLLKFIPNENPSLAFFFSISTILILFGIRRV